ncbi:Hypothetical_protein [Hexamita inflata]|uniref:Hypothetical_protein n=1 Tax=Hexamita inflata TaxID=28002 RepID=A0AA86QXC3_9EUKA|nr:Hypothetical protein HINF_LOCUS53518 [Hexamita inflata]
MQQCGALKVSNMKIFNCIEIENELRAQHGSTALYNPRVGKYAVVSESYSRFQLSLLLCYTCRLSLKAGAVNNLQCVNTQYSYLYIFHSFQLNKGNTEMKQIQDKS